MEGKMSLYLVAALVAAAARWSVTYNSYSGAGKPPMFGDYEAQRHWMEITYNLPVQQWYLNSTENDLSYWGLDYPPLTAYHSWLCGYVANMVDPTWVALRTSRGHESAEHKLFMRYTVLVADFLIYLPAVAAFVHFTLQGKNNFRKALVAGVVMMYPGLMLIDHGHFQYNCISLGFALWSAVSIFLRRDFLASFLFVLALNYKQMELYHSLPFFFYLLGVCLKEKSWLLCLKRLIFLGSVVLGTMALCWFPFLRNKDDAIQVLHRIFPFARGLYEDKVANVWCALSVVIKLKQVLPGDQLLRLSTVSTLVSCLPSSIDLLCRPSPRRFLLSLANCSLAFFLFSYQVHEKSILLAALPICLLLPTNPVASAWFLIVSVFSMFPLLIRDGQGSSYVSLMLLFAVLCVACFYDSFNSPFIILMLLASCAGICVLHGLILMVPPPDRLPDLYPVLISIFSCSHFLAFMIYFSFVQFNLSLSSKLNQVDSKKTN